MPVPNEERLGDKITREEIVRIYEEEKGWSKKLRVKWVEVNGRTKRPELHILEFNADTMPCSNRECIPYMLTFVQFRPTGVIWTCAACRKSDGPIMIENAQIIEEKEITVQEAWDIIRETGQYPPVGLERPKERRYQIIS